VNPLDLSQEQRESIAQQKAATKAALDALHHADTEARAQVMAILTPDQQAKASRLESDARRVARARTERLADEAVYSGGGGSWNRLRSLPEN
jgi:Spy/CpxP family protein refolding chaperone